MEEKEVLSEDKVYDVLAFANNMYGYLKNGVWNPYTSNQNLVNLNNAPIKATYQALIDALSQSLTDANNLQGYSEFMAVFDTIYKKTLDYYKSMLSFDMHISCMNYSNTSEFKSQEYKDDLKRFHKFLDNFKYKDEFLNKVIPQVLETGIFYGWFRDSEGTINDNPIDINENEISIKRRSKYSLQIMPQKQCLLTDQWEDGWLYDFNMNYFLSPTVDIRLFDPSFIKKFKEVFQNPEKTGMNYVPSAQFQNRDGTYALWTQTNPKEGAVCIKYDASNGNIIPPFGNLMKATFDNTQIHKLQLDKDMASAWAVLYGSIGVMDKEKNGQHPNQTVFSPDVMGNFMNLVQNALQSIMKTVALPLEDTHFGQFIDQTPTMESTAIETSAAQGAYGSSLIYSTGKRNAEEVKNGIIADANLMKRLYPQFANILNYYGNKKTKKYKFKCVFDGTNFPFEREYRRKALNELVTIGLVPNTSYFASVYGIAPQDFDRMLDEAHYGDMQDKLTMLMNANTMGKVGQGAPKKSSNDLSEGGNVAQDY